MIAPPNPEEASVELLKALGHPLRLRIVALLAGGERNVGEIEQISGIGQPGLSQQLAVLRQAGLVQTRREAKLVFYRLAADPLRQLAALIASLVPADPAPTPSGNPPARAPAEGAAQFARLV